MIVLAFLGFLAQRNSSDYTNVLSDTKPKIAVMTVVHILIEIKFPKLHLSSSPMLNGRTVQRIMNANK